MSRNRYKLGRQIHQGPTSSVYMARQVGLGREVVLKVFHCDSDQATRRFRREVASLAKLRHPNNVQILDTGSAMFGGQPRPLLAMEYIPGRTVREVLDEEVQFSPYRAWRLGVQILSALAEAHSLNMVHRDIKPENLMCWSPPGLPELIKVIDYGLADKVGLTTRISVDDGEKAGTPHYMAPELASGKRPSPASDVYAVAVVLYEMLAGRRPFDGTEGVAILYQQVHAEPEPLDSHASLPPRLAEIVTRAMNKDPAERFRDANEFLEAMREVSPGELRSYELVDLDPADSMIALATPDAPGSSGVWDAAMGLDEVLGSSGPSASRRSKEMPSVWFFTEDPAMKDPELLQAIGMCAAEYEVETLDGEERAAALEEVQAGRAQLPWVVVFGDLHVMLEEPLLGEFRNASAVSRLLVSTHLNAEMLQATVNYCGLDQQIDLPATAPDIVAAIKDMVERTRGLHLSDDRLRMALRIAHQRAETLGERLGLDQPRRATS